MDIDLTDCYRRNDRRTKTITGSLRRRTEWSTTLSTTRRGWWRRIGRRLRTLRHGMISVKITAALYSSYSSSSFSGNVSKKNICSLRLIRDWHHKSHGIFSSLTPSDSVMLGLAVWRCYYLEHHPLTRLLIVNSSSSLETPDRRLLPTDKPFTFFPFWYSRFIFNDEMWLSRSFYSTKLLYNVTVKLSCVILYKWTEQSAE